MSSKKHSPDLAVTIRELLENLRPEDPNSVENLRAVYADDVSFEDPIQKVTGIDAFIALNHRLLGRAKELVFEVESATGNSEEIFLAWTMRCVPKFGPTIHVDGVTHIHARDGKVVRHRDYWDLGELFASAIPGGHQALRFLLKPMA